LITLKELGIVLANNGNVYLSHHRRADNDQFPSNLILSRKNFNDIALIGNLLKVLAE